MALDCCACGRLAFCLQHCMAECMLFTTSDWLWQATHAVCFCMWCSCVNKARTALLTRATSFKIASMCPSPAATCMGVDETESFTEGSHPSWANVSKTAICEWKMNMSILQCLQAVICAPSVIQSILAAAFEIKHVYLIMSSCVVHRCPGVCTTAKYIASQLLCKRSDQADFAFHSC